jgi:translation elongation factor EF-1beta
MTDVQPATPRVDLSQLPHQLKSCINAHVRWHGS